MATNWVGEIGSLGSNLFQSLQIYMMRTAMEQNLAIKQMAINILKTYRDGNLVSLNSEFANMPLQIAEFMPWINSRLHLKAILEGSSALQNTYVPDERKKNFIGSLWDEVKNRFDVGKVVRIGVLSAFKKPMIKYITKRGGTVSNSDSLTTIAEKFYNKARGNSFDGDYENIAPALLGTIIEFVLNFFKGISEKENPTEEEKALLAEVDPNANDGGSFEMGTEIKIILALLALLVLAKVMKWI